MKLILKRNSRPRWYVQLDRGIPVGDILADQSWRALASEVAAVCKPHGLQYRLIIKTWADFVAFYRKSDAILFMLKAGAKNESEV